MSKRIESSVTGYVMQWALDDGAALETADGIIKQPLVLDCFLTNKRVAEKWSRQKRRHWNNLPRMTFDVRKVRVTLIVEDITDEEARHERGEGAEQHQQVQRAH